MFNTGLVSTAVISLFMLAIILGFLFGWIRGFSKSLIRFFMVLGMAVLAFFVVPALTKTILEADISKWNININGIQVLNLKDFIGELLRKIPVVEDLVHASPTLEAFIKFLPFMIGNVLLFLVFFFLFKYISLIIYWIIAGIFFNKKKMEGKDKHKFIGAVIGAVQGILIACVCFVPVFGIIDTAEPVLQAAIAENAAAEEDTAETETAETVMPEVYYAEIEGEDESAESKEMVEKMEKAATEVEKYTSAFDNTWIIKVLNSLGVRKLSVNMFDKLTTITSDNVTYSLRNQVKAVANVVPQAKAILESGLDMEDNVCLEKIRKAVNVMFDDEVFGNIIREIVPEAADKWSLNEKFCGISKPNFSNTAVDTLFESMLVKIVADKGENAKNDVNVSIDLLEICNDADLIKSVKDGDDIMTVFSSKKDLMANLIDKALESNTLKNVMPELVNFGLDVIYKALGEENEAKVTINASDIHWDPSDTDTVGEKARIKNIFTNLITIYSDVKDTENPLDKLDFGLLGQTFDYLRASQLFGAGEKNGVAITSVSKDLVETLFNSDLLNLEENDSNNTTVKSFKDKILDIWDQDNSLEDTFIALGDAYKMSQSLQDINNLEISDLKDIVKTLVTNDSLSEFVKDETTLVGIGLDEDMAKVVSETLDKVLTADLDEEALTNEIDAIAEVYNVANKVLNPEVDEVSTEIIPVVIETDDANTLVDSIANSEVILGLITDTESTTYTDLGIAEKLATESKEAIKEALDTNEKLNTEDYADQLAALKALFGIQD